MKVEVQEAFIRLMKKLPKWRESSGAVIYEDDWIRYTFWPNGNAYALKSVSPPFNNLAMPATSVSYEVTHKMIAKTDKKSLSFGVKREVARIVKEEEVTFMSEEQATAVVNRMYEIALERSLTWAV